MNNPLQLELIEPEGERLVELCLNNLKLGISERRNSEFLQDAGFAVAADLLRDFADRAVERAGVFGTAYQFERLAGLS